MKFVHGSFQHAGEYQDEPGKMECKRCDAGLYQDRFPDPKVIGSR